MNVPIARYLYVVQRDDAVRSAIRAPAHRGISKPANNERTERAVDLTARSPSAKQRSDVANAIEDRCLRVSGSYNESHQAEMRMKPRTRRKPKLAREEQHKTRLQACAPPIQRIRVQLRAHHSKPDAQPAHSR